MRALASVPDPGPGVRAMQQFAAGFVDGDTDADARRETYFRTSIDVVIAGWEQRLEARTAPPDAGDEFRRPDRSTPT